MKPLVIAVLLAVTAALAVVASTCEVEVFFVSPSVDQAIEPRIIEALDLAADQVLIALYSFTDNELGVAVVRAYLRGVEVYVLMDDGQDINSQGREWPNLVAAGVPVAVEHETGLLHHKFVVIDGKTVITGSYNWSDSADDKNFEDAVFITCSEIAKQYITEFCYIAKVVLGLDWCVTGCDNNNDKCEQCLARLNSATRSQFDEVEGIGETLSARLVENKPYIVSPCTRSGILAELSKVERIGDILSERIVNHFCSDLFE